MLIVRYERDDTAAVGLLVNDELRELAEPTTIERLLELTAVDLREWLEGELWRSRVIDGATLLPPVDGRTEVWAAGVTYEQSRDAREAESSEPSVYTRVYDADRPELFFKSVAWRVVANGDAIGIRADSGNDVPEAELALVINAHGEIVGVSAGNDVSSRTIEGANPLYLPQAKIYEASCALGPGIRPIWEVDDLRRLGIELTISRAGEVVFGGRASSASLRRHPDELVGFLFRAMRFPAGAILLTGTSLVPELDFTMTEGDVVSITIDGVGTLTNTVRVVG